MTLIYTSSDEVFNILQPNGFGNAQYIFQPTAAQIAALQAANPTAEFRQVIDGAGNILLIHFSNGPLNQDVDVNGNPCFIFGTLFQRTICELTPYARNSLNHPRLTTGGLWYNTSLVGTNTTALAVTKAAYLIATQGRLQP